MITAVSAAALEHKDLIIKLATQFRLPVVYAYRVFAAHGVADAIAAGVVELRAIGVVQSVLDRILADKTAGCVGTPEDYLNLINQRGDHKP
jgi:hypothetical protein